MLAVIGGTGLYQMEGLSSLVTEDVETPFGKPSAPVTIGEILGEKVAFLPRHGNGHSLLPSEINYRANIFALKKVGVTQIYSLSATGSLKKEICPGDLAIVAQYFDWTRGGRANTFFGKGIVAHVSTAKPCCSALTRAAVMAAETLNIPVHKSKTYACVEGSRFGTQAESFFLRNAGCDLVGMTNVPEAFLAREAQMCYCTIAVATDYDCWLEDENAHVTAEKALALYRENIGKIRSIISHIIKDKKTSGGCVCRNALEGAVMTPEQNLSDDHKKLLSVLRK